MDNFDASISFESPIGPISIYSRNNKVAAVNIGERCAHFGSSKALKDAQRQLLKYLAGKSSKFELDYELQGTEFQKAVWRQIAAIPFGKTMTYSEIAAAVGNPKAVRAVGGAVGANPIPIFIGCHRVLGATGKITGYSGGDGIPTKRALLAIEKIMAKD